MARIKKGTRGWICPICKRPFGTKNQWHSCVTVNPRDIVAKSPAAVQKTYKKVIAFVKKLKGTSVSAAKSCIFAKCPSTYLAIKFTKEQMILEFFLPEETQEFPVVKTFPYTKSRVVHYVHWDGDPIVWKTLQRWIRKSHEMVYRK